MAFAPRNSAVRSYRSLGAAVFGGVPTVASLTTNLTGNNNDLTYTAVGTGHANQNNTTVRYVVSGASTALSVSVTGTAITVNVATDASSVATSTASQVRAAVAASSPASALVTVANAPGNDGTGVVTALAATNLSGGAYYVVGTPGSAYGSRR